MKRKGLLRLHEKILYITLGEVVIKKKTSLSPLEVKNLLCRPDLEHVQ
jgi:hypothetical protein